MAIMKNENWAAWPKLHAGGDDKLGIEFAWPKRAWKAQWSKFKEAVSDRG